MGPSTKEPESDEAIKYKKHASMASHAKKTPIPAYLGVPQRNASDLVQHKKMPLHNVQPATVEL